MQDDIIVKLIVITWRICRWFFLQIILMFLMPYLWADHYNGETICLMLLYTALYAIYWETVPKDKRLRWLFLPYFMYSGIAILLYGLIKTWNVSVWYSFLLPIYGATCVILAKICGKQIRRIRKKYKFGKIITYSAVLLFFVALKSISVSWECSKRNSSEKEDILARKDYLLGKLMVDPQVVLNEMPAATGTQFQGEWALYSCSMLSAALVNISQLYPETKARNIQLIDSLINIVMSPELRYYDTMRWYEDPLESLDGDESHISYLSHLAWMICGYKQIGGDLKYGYLGQRFAHSYYPEFLHENEQKIMLYGKYYSHDLMLEKALDFIGENAQRPFFLYFSPTIPHADLDIMKEAMAEYGGEFCETPFEGGKGGYKSQIAPRAAYAAMVTYLDKSVGLIIKELKEKGLYDNTIIVFTSDNGVHSEGGHDPYYFDSNGPFRGQKRDLYEGGIRTPFVVQWPGVIPRGVVTNHISTFWDFLPTVCELVHADVPQNIDGISYLPALTGKGTQKEHDCIYYEFFELGGKQSIMTPDGWKLVRLEVSDPSKTYEELYNIYTDPAETANVIKQYPDVAKKLKNMIDGQRVENARFHF